jgi:FkbM family methyltransferase
VVSFEPTRRTFALLAANATGRDNMTAVPKAVWSHSDTVTLTDCGAGYSPYNSVYRTRLPDAVRARVSTVIHEVEAVSLDGYVSATGTVPDLVKVDVESAEMRVIEGMADLLRGRRPAVVLEVGDLGVPDVPLSSELVRAFADHDYLPYELVDGRPTAHRPRSEYGYDNLVFLPREEGSTRRV